MQLTEIILNSGTNMQMGPATAELVRNCFILLSDRGLSFNMTERLMVDDLFLRHHASQCTHGQCRDYFIHRHLRKSAAQRRVYTEAFLTRISIFLADPRIRAMLSSGENDLDLRRAMDEGKIVLIDINKGQLSENARLLGGMFLLSLQHAALSRTDIPENERQPWTAFVDEHQSLASSVALQPLLNETRKFGIGLVLASQTYASMDKTLIQNIQTNCAHQIYFRLSADDASLGTAGLIGEERELAKRQIVQLPVATALMSRYGQRLERIKINRCDIPENLTDEHLDIIRQIRQSAGVALTEALNEPNIAENDTPPASSYEPVQEEQDITREDDERDDFIEGEYE